MVGQSLRHKIMQRCNGCCEECGGNVELTLHHLHYDSVGFESQDDLAALCWDCHKSKHVDPAGVYWRDPQEMQCHWSYYYEELDRW